jgi:Zn ribbon nucleic-acid-binding protein
MLTCPRCGCRVIRVVRTFTVIEDGKEYEVDLLECTRCGHQEKETND